MQKYIGLSALKPINTQKSDLEYQFSKGSMIKPFNPTPDLFIGYIGNSSLLRKLLAKWRLATTH